MKTKFLAIVVLFWILNACGGSSTEPNYSQGGDGTAMMEKTASNDEMSSPPPPPPPPPGSTIKGENTTVTELQDIDNVEKKIIKTADVRFGVSDYKKSRANIDVQIKKYKGFVSQENETNSSMSIGNQIIIRVPAQNFDSLLNALEGEAKQFESKSISLNDVTEEFIDIEKRLENKKKVEAQYLEILKKAYTVSDILEVNEHVRVIREEIDSSEGRLKYLRNQVVLSTITLYVHQDFDTVSYGFFHKIGEALAGGWDGFLAFLVGLFYIWPLLLIATVVFLLIRKGIRKRRAKRNQQTT
jgi:hypothetical protein